MALMRMPSGEVYDVPDAEVRLARTQFGAVPADSAPPPVRMSAPPMAAPSDTLQGTGTNVGSQAAGLAGGALESIGGLRGLATVAATGAGLYGAGRFLRDRFGRKPAPQAAPQRQTATAPGQSVMPSPAKQRQEEARARKMEADADAAEARRDAARAKVGTAESRTKPAAKKAGTAAPTKKGKAPAARQVSGPDLDPDNPAILRTKGEASGPELLKRRTELIEAARRRGGDAAAEAMEARIPMPKIRGKVAGVGRGLAKYASPAAGLLMTLLDSRNTPEQMAEADALFNELRARRMQPSTRRAFTEEPEVY